MPSRSEGDQNEMVKPTEVLQAVFFKINKGALEPCLLIHLVLGQINKGSGKDHVIVFSLVFLT